VSYAGIWDSAATTPHRLKKWRAIGPGSLELLRRLQSEIGRILQSGRGGTGARSRSVTDCGAEAAFRLCRNGSIRLFTPTRPSAATCGPIFAANAKRRKRYGRGYQSRSRIPGPFAGFENRAGVAPSDRVLGGPYDYWGSALGRYSDSSQAEITIPSHGKTDRELRKANAADDSVPLAADGRASYDPNIRQWQRVVEPRSHYEHAG